MPHQPQPRTEVYAFSTPVVKPGAVEIAARLADGLHVIAAHRSVWRGLYKHLEVLFAGPQGGGQMSEDRGQTADPKLPQPLNRESCLRAPRATYGECAKKCEAAWADITADLTQRAYTVAEKHGIRVASFSNWIAVHHSRELGELRRAAGISRPCSALLKPSGQIL